MVNPLFEGGGGGGGLLQPPLFRSFPLAVFAFLLGSPFDQFTHPLSRYPCICEKLFKTYRNFHLLVFSFCYNNEYVLEILET